MYIYIQVSGTTPSMAVCKTSALISNNIINWSVCLFQNCLLEKIIFAVNSSIFEEGFRLYNIILRYLGTIKK